MICLLSRQQVVPVSQSYCISSAELTVGRGGVANLRESLVLYNNHSILSGSGVA
jgi:hypothetical protein